MTAEMWRAPSSVIRKAGRYGFVQDGGIMRHAYKTSSPPHYYFFDDNPIAAKPMVLIGTINEIFEFLMVNKTSGILNKIDDLPEIYMGVSQCKPTPRFVGLFPVNDVLSQLLDKGIGLLGAGIGNVMGEFSTLAKMPHTALEISGGAKDLKDAGPDGKNPYQKALHKSKIDKKSIANKFAITWSYLQEKGLKKIGEKSVSFSALYGYADQELMKLLKG